MPSEKKTDKQTQPDPGPHPETKRHPSGGVPDEKSSKVRPDPRPDGRGGHDKDGNEEHPAPRRAVP